jgi:flagellar hook-length control protein FliK
MARAPVSDKLNEPEHVGEPTGRKTAKAADITPPTAPTAAVAADPSAVGLSSVTGDDLDAPAGPMQAADQAGAAHLGKKIPNGLQSAGDEDATSTPAQQANPQAAQGGLAAVTPQTDSGSVTAPADPSTTAKVVEKLTLDGVVDDGHAAVSLSPASAGPTHQASSPTAAPVVRPQLEFAAVNHEKIVAGIQGQLLPTGGTMHIRLDPPHLGPLQVSVHLRDGVVTAAFQTQNEDATRLLSHSLGQLKTALESQGVSVDKLQVQQAPKDQSSGNNSNDPRQQSFTQGDGLFEQQQRQRQRLLQRMWNRMNGDPLDMVA